MAGLKIFVVPKRYDMHVYCKMVTTDNQYFNDILQQCVLMYTMECSLVRPIDTAMDLTWSGL